MSSFIEQFPLFHTAADQKVGGESILSVMKVLPEFSKAMILGSRA